MLATLMTLALATALPDAQPRWALLIGSHAGSAATTPLAFAGRDAQRLGDVLVGLGDFPPDHVVTLVDPTPDGVRAALGELDRRIRADGAADRSMVLVYYSGHADREAMQFGDARLPWSEFLGTIDRAAAGLRVVIVDACRAGVATRVKGLVPDPGFTLPTRGEPVPEGTAILASTSQGENAQESDALSASFFTHHLLSALRGAADFDRDGQVILEEAFRYARDQTVVSTAASDGGVQHPTYRFDVKGRADVVMTRPGASRAQGRIVLPGAGRFVFFEGALDGPLVTELVSRAPGTVVALPAGRLGVRWRRAADYAEGQVDVAPGAQRDLDARTLASHGYSTVVSKGTERGILVVRVDPPHARVTVGEQALGDGATHGVPVAPGPVDVFVSAPDHAPYATTVEVGWDDVVFLDVTLEPTASGVAPWVGWTLIGTGAVAVGVGAYLSFDRAVAYQDEANALPLPAAGAPDPEYERLHDKAVTYQTTGLVMGGVGLALAASGVILLLTSDDGGDASDASRTDAPWLVPAVSLTPDGGVLGASARF